MSPAVSVIVPNYNHEIFLDKRINSILNQTYQDFELIILDDYSTDNSRDIIEKYRGHKKTSQIIYNVENSGSTFKQWNKGICLAKGKYIWIAESDDFCEPHFLEKLIMLHKQGGNIGIAYCKSLPVNDQNLIYDRSDWWMKRVAQNRWEQDFNNTGIDECRNYLAVQCTIPNASAVLFNAECLKMIDWDEMHYKVCGDWYIYAAVLRNYNIIYESEPLNYHRNHSNNARSRYHSNIIIEQYSVLNYINSIVKVNKTLAYYKSLDERMSNFISLIKLKKITIKKTLSVLLAMRKFDPFFIFRFFKILIFRALKIKFNFE